MSTKTRTPKAATMPADQFSVDALTPEATALVYEQGPEAADMPADMEAPKSEEEAPTVDAPATVRPATGGAARRYMLAKEARDAITLQRPGKGLGQQWRSAGYKAPSVRHAALQALADVAEEDEDGQLIVTYEAALRAFKTLADEGRLGCSTPAGRIAKFVRSEHLVAC